MSAISGIAKTNINEGYKAPIRVYAPKRSYSQISNRILNTKSDFSKSSAQNEAFKVAMERVLIAKKIWEDFLEKLRKSGGGGGGSLRRIDRIAVSMMLSTFLSDKMVKALIENLNFEFLKQTAFMNNSINQNPLFQSVLKLGNIFVNSLINTGTQIAKSPIVQNIGKNISNFLRQVSILAIAFSFQLNKLKELIEKELDEMIKKLDIKTRVNNIKKIVVDFFVEFKEGLLDIWEALKDIC